jgi:hypothetical protein
MVHLPVTLPNGVTAELYYMHDYGSGGAFNYIQHARTNSIFMVPDPPKFEEKYWHDLEKNRSDFATQIPTEFDLIIDAPSNSGWHRPFTSAVCRVFPGIPFINFIKETNGPGIKAFNNNVAGWDQAKRVLIVDDVFNPGKIAASVIDRLQQYSTNQLATFMIACPLRVPAPAGGSIDDINAAVEEILSKKSS